MHKLHFINVHRIFLCHSCIKCISFFVFCSCKRSVFPTFIFKFSRCYLQCLLSRKRGERVYSWDHMLEYLLFIFQFQGQRTSASSQRMIDSLQKAVGMKYSTWPWLRVLKRTRAASVFLPKSHQTDRAGRNINHSTVTTAPGHKLAVTDQNKSRPTCSVVITSHTLESWGLSHQMMINALEIIDRLWPWQFRMDIVVFGD